MGIRTPGVGSAQRLPLRSLLLCEPWPGVCPEEEEVPTRQVGSPEGRDHGPKTRVRYEEEAGKRNCGGPRHWPPKLRLQIQQQEEEKANVCPLKTGSEKEPGSQERR